MKLTILDRLLSPNRRRRKMISYGQLAAPIATRDAAAPEDAPWVVSLSTGTFTMTRPDREGYIGQAFFECPSENEDTVTRNLYRTLWNLSVKHGWDNRCGSIDQAIKKMEAGSLKPESLAVPFSLLSEVCGQDLTEEEADRITLAKGCVTEVAGVRVYSVRKALPDNAAMLVTAPALAGTYTRIHDHVALTVMKADRSFVLVGDVPVD